MALSPEMLNSYLTTGEAFSKTDLSPTEQEVVLIATSVENNSHYCVAAHTCGAHSIDVSAQDLNALRAGVTVPDSKLNALRDFTRKVVTNRGQINDDDVDALLCAGYTRKNVLEVLLGVASKTISNYVNNLVDPPLDAKFEPNKWEKPSFLNLARRPDVLKRALRVAVIVGPIIGGINHGDNIMAGTMALTDWLKVGLTFLVPFSVATWSAVMALRNGPGEV